MQKNTVCNLASSTGKKKNSTRLFFRIVLVSFPEPFFFFLHFLSDSAIATQETAGSCLDSRSQVAAKMCPFLSCSASHTGMLVQICFSLWLLLIMQEHDLCWLMHCEDQFYTAGANTALPSAPHCAIVSRAMHTDREIGT